MTLFRIERYTAVTQPTSSTLENPNPLSPINPISPIMSIRGNPTNNPSANPFASDSSQDFNQGTTASVTSTNGAATPQPLQQQLQQQQAPQPFPVLPSSHYSYPTSSPRIAPSHSATDIANLDSTHHPFTLPHRSASMVFPSSGVPAAPLPPAAPLSLQRSVEASAAAALAAGGAGTSAPLAAAPMDGLEPRMFPGALSSRRRSTATAAQMGPGVASAAAGQLLGTDGMDGVERMDSAGVELENGDR